MAQPGKAGPDPGSGDHASDPAWRSSRRAAVRALHPDAHPELGGDPSLLREALERFERERHARPPRPARQPPRVVVHRRRRGALGWWDGWHLRRTRPARDLR